MSSMLLLTGLAAVSGGVFLVAVAVLPAGPPRVPLSRVDPTAAPPTSALSGVGSAAGSAVGKVLHRRGWAVTGAVALERAGVAMALPDFVLAVGLVAALAAVVGSLVGGLVLGLLLPVVVLLGTRVLVRLRAGRRQAAFADQLDDSLQLMASSLRAGHSILRAMDSVATEAAAPTSEEFSRIINETRVGRDLADALDEVAGRMGSEDFTWVAQAIAIQREVGGNLAEVLDAVGHTIRERNAIRRQVKALSAEGKLSAIVLMALPFGIIAFISMTNPGYLSAFTESWIGYAMLAVAAGMMLVGGLWLKKTVAIRF
ncbi:type II secretion system F family protein [Blastococcus saxobsidens]|uniref:Flp pilus assembly protein n=1 Tax=Blastococcus saxobsidens (strain DD2) TaxID=1146883 RepID=H6RRT2_BLASD|nr:type II secretion system F family protein [Blastococcus saxobsidens]CCG02926.1 Flp pilus assembly protein [Blastococcus saxobsidens DD2]